jgi:hypothetical protein
MKPIFVALQLLLFGGATALPGLSAGAETPWDALRHLPKHHVYTVLESDGSCFTGAFVSVSENVFVIDQGGEKPLPKADIVRISSGETPDVHYYLFELNAGHRRYPQFTGPLLGVSSNQLTLVVDHKEMRFSKEFLARVFLTGKKPAFECAVTS